MVSTKAVLSQRRAKVRDLLHELRACGWRPVRCRGSHQTWRAPDGDLLTVVVNHPGHDVSPVVLASVRRALLRPEDSGGDALEAENAVMRPPRSGRARRDDDDDQR
jgi:predicted RNA binding protein YcfA (HicA-like mRNA interferase family)